MKIIDQIPQRRELYGEGDINVKRKQKICTLKVFQRIKFDNKEIEFLRDSLADLSMQFNISVTRTEVCVYEKEKIKASDINKGIVNTTDKLDALSNSLKKSFKDFKNIIQKKLEEFHRE